MTIYLNNSVPLENYKELINEEYFVDKSSIIDILNKKISTKSKYVCVTRPRRFGKSTVAQMLGGYYSNHRFESSLKNSLSCVVTLAYLPARDTYRVEREEKTGKGNCTSYTFSEVSDSHKKKE